MWIRIPVLRRFWLEFAVDRPEDLPPGARSGCGVTALTLEEATALVQERVFGGTALPPTRRVVSDIDVSTLDPRRVRNMGDPLREGIWFPPGYRA